MSLDHGLDTDETWTSSRLRAQARLMKCQDCGNDVRTVKSPTGWIKIDPDPDQSGTVFFVAGFAINSPSNAHHTRRQVYRVHGCALNAEKKRLRELVLYRAETQRLALRMKTSDKL